MVKIDILGGLREAIARGKSLREAMLSFYNAGYSKEEIEEAARQVQMLGPIDVIKEPAVKEKKPVKEQQKQGKEAAKPVQHVSGYGPTSSQKDESIKKIKERIDSAMDELEAIEFPNGKPGKDPKNLPPTNISGYIPKKSKTKSKIVVALLIIFMILLLGVIASLFIFKDQVVELINSGFFSGLF